MGDLRTMRPTKPGISRRWGGIHPWFDDYPGRVMGETIGQRAFARSLEYFRQAPGSGNPDPGNCSSHKVTICHKPGRKRKGGVTITVSRNALPAHMAHGDTMGACETEASAPRQVRRGSGVVDR